MVTYTNPQQRTKEKKRTAKREREIRTRIDLSDRVRGVCNKRQTYFFSNASLASSKFVPYGTRDVRPTKPTGKKTVKDQTRKVNG